MQNLLDALGFDHRIRGDHYIYYFGNHIDLINLQPDSNKVKPAQLPRDIVKYEPLAEAVQLCFGFDKE